MKLAAGARILDVTKITDEIINSAKKNGILAKKDTSD